MNKFKILRSLIKLIWEYLFFISLGKNIVLYPILDILMLLLRLHAGIIKSMLS
jgi:hypothetical protein